MKKIIIGILLSLLIAANVNALQEVAGPIIITVAAGGSNSSRYGLINDGNETVVVSLRAEGDVAKYLSFPQNVSLEPKKLVYVNVTASLPTDYDLGQNITGFLYALQEGQPGQVKINIQLMKSITIIASPIDKNKTSSKQDSPLTGFFASISNYSYVIVILVIALAIIFMLYTTQRKKNSSHLILETAEEGRYSKAAYVSLARESKYPKMRMI
ncbi:MAG: hypothetical protein NTW30_03290 [Candidatus Aenigmarchaeota archaeon]|nr:hypothetical protein [Candidatus Aenigmarchaeota archaeon]